MAKNLTNSSTVSEKYSETFKVKSMDIIVNTG